MRPEDRQLTSRLYGGDQRLRIRQEVLLGIGGMRALRAMGIDPGVIHLNEGHSAFAVLEEIRRRMEYEAIDFAEAAHACIFLNRFHDTHARPGRT